MATNEYKFFYGGGANEWVRRLASKVNEVADESNLIAGIDHRVSHHNNLKTAKRDLLRHVQNSTPRDDVEILEDFIHDHGEGWLVLTKNGSVFEKGYGESLQRTMDAFETDRMEEHRKKFRRFRKQFQGSIQIKGVIIIMV